MINIRRYFKEGNLYFLTHVTYHRSQILISYFNLLCSSIVSHQERNDFDLIAWVILPDHMHLLVNPKKNNLSLLMRRIKLSFSTRYRRLRDMNSGRVWQYRFWDHIIRNQNDMNRHIDYIHYQDDWGVKDEIIFNGRYGE